MCTVREINSAPLLLLIPASNDGIILQKHSEVHIVDKIPPKIAHDILAKKHETINTSSHHNRIEFGSSPILCSAHLLGPIAGKDKFFRRGFFYGGNSHPAFAGKIRDRFHRSDHDYGSCHHGNHHYPYPHEPEILALKCFSFIEMFFL